MTSPAATLRETIAHRPISLYQSLVILMTAFMNLLDGFDVLALAFTASAIKQDLGLSPAELGYLLSAGLIGMTAGALFLGPVADRIGRRPLLLIAVALSAAGMLGSAFSAGVWSLGIARVVTGLGVGGILVGTNVLTGEYAPLRWRSLAISVYASGFGIGAVLGGMFAVVLQAQYGWHSVFIGGFALTAVLFIVLLLWLPESIDFLETRQPADALEKLQAIAKRIGVTEKWTLPEKKDLQARAKISAAALFTPEYARTTVFLWIAFFAVMFSYYFVGSWTPALLKEAGMTSEQSVTIGMLISLGGTLGSLLYGLIASRFGAKNVLIAYILFGSACTVIFILSADVLWLAMAFGVLAGGFLNGCISGLYTLNPSVYGAALRSTGAGWSIGIGRIGAILAPIAAGELLQIGWERQSLYIGAGAVLLVAAAAVLLIRYQEKPAKPAA